MTSQESAVVVEGNIIHVIICIHISDLADTDSGIRYRCRCNNGRRYRCVMSTCMNTKLNTDVSICICVRQVYIYTYTYL